MKDKCQSCGHEVVVRREESADQYGDTLVSIEYECDRCGHEYEDLS